MDKLAVEGLSISYSRVLVFQENISKKFCQQHLGEGVVCSRNLEERLFTVVVTDNVDHDVSSATDKCLFQGISTSVSQRNKSNLLRRKFVYENNTHIKSLLAIFHEF